MMQSRRDSLFLLILGSFALMLSSCQTLSAHHGFSSAQIAALESQGFQQVGENYELSLENRILFEFDSSTVRPETALMLERLAHVLLDVRIGGATVEGHTDNVGEESYNFTLSENRATAVKQALIAGGMHGAELRVAGFGETEPVENNDSETGRQQNRRVVLVVSPSDAMAL